MIKGLLALLQALLLAISAIAAPNTSFRRDTDMAAISITSKADFGFDAITAEEMKISSEEKTMCRNWYNDNILTTKAPAYDVTIGGKKLSESIGDYDITIGTESEIGATYKGGKTTLVTLKHKLSSLVLTVEATIYEEYATCEWRIFVKNSGKENSPVITDFYAINKPLETGESTLYYSKGSSSDENDFELYKTSLHKTPLRFFADSGRHSFYLPYFNIEGANFGTVVSLGWTGQWFANIGSNKTTTTICAGQQEFDAYLLANEQVRSPLVSLTFYKNNALKGFNSLRNWEMDCVCPESIVPNNGFVIANEFSTLTADELIAKIDNLDPEILENTDYFWMDAGWYKYTDSWWDGVGNWIPDPNRFPNTLKPVGDKIASLGKKFLLWFEPERVREGTYLYNEGIKHSDWIITIGDDLLWNLGSDEAYEFLSNYIAKALVDNGVTMYRQDFNFAPLEYWQKADNDHYNGRKGICENHYVTNLYNYLDKLCNTVDGLVIDNCAAGGRRLDIEMTRRSLPLWRSDYNCGNADGTIKENVLEATQTMTYGLSCWIPYSGTNRYFHSEYASRSAILTNQSVYEPAKDEYVKYENVSQYMTGNYYPLTYGGVSSLKYLAMQFGDENEGTALIYKREHVISNKYTLKLNGLNPNATYELTDIDGIIAPITIKGSDLMNKGVEISIKDTPKAVVIMYKVK